jgi:hypothetical protein
MRRTGSYWLSASRRSRIHGRRNGAAILRGRAERVAGYAVAAVPAVGILAKASPEAAACWHENTPHLIAPQRYLVFHEEVCRIAGI